MNEEKKKALRFIRTAKGQLEGIEKMLEEGRYCIDISNQLLASDALIKKAQRLILKQHLEHCIVNAVNSKDKQIMEEKFQEIEELIEKMSR